MAGKKSVIASFVEDYENCTQSRSSVEDEFFHHVVAHEVRPITSAAHTPPNL